MIIFLLVLLRFSMFYSSAQIEICPLELCWSKVLASMDENPFHPARPLVSVVAVKGLGGRKTFHRVAAILIHLPVAHHLMQRALVKIKQSSAPHVL